MTDTQAQPILAEPVVAANDLATTWYADAPQGIRANMVTSLDGQAEFNGRVRPLSGALDQALLRALRLFADVVLVGAGTIRAERYGPVSFTAEGREIRRRLTGSDDPPPVAVVTSTGQLPTTSRLFDADPAPIIVTTTRASAQAAQTGADVIAAGESTVDLPEAVAALRERGLGRILCEGGPTLLAGLVAAGLLDELCLTMAPKFAGPQPAAHNSATPLTMPAEFVLAHSLVHDNFLFLRYRR